jgi:hypothetical protein
VTIFYCLRFETSLFVASYNSQGYGGRIRPRLHTGFKAGTNTSTVDLRSQSYITTDGQPASLSWNKAPIRGLRPDLYYCLTVAGLLIWGAFSDERTGLPFAIATGLASAVIFGSVSDSRLPFSSPHTTRRVTVEVFDPASTRVTALQVKAKVKVILRLTVSQSVNLGVEPHWGPWPDIYYSLTVTVLFCGAPSLTRGRVCLFICCWLLPAQSFLGPIT